MNLFPGQEPNKDIEKGLGDTAGEGKAGTNWKSSTDAYTPPRIKQIASGRLLCNTGSSAQGSVMT